MSRTVPLVAAEPAEPLAPPLQSETGGPPNKYLYEEFAGYEGERLLKSILHKILSMALYRTWEVLVERQAPGNDCFLSIASISETAERAERTIRLNIHEFEARKLMVLRPEQKLLRQPDQSLKVKLVVVKDFSGLYALAHEYLRWTQSDCYIEPERDFAEVLRSDDVLKRKVIRFNNYRRIIENKVPGPKPIEREEHRWYTEYTPEIDSQELGTAGGTATPLKETLRAGSAEEDISPTIRNLYVREDLQEDLKKDSKERITPNDHKDPLCRDSFDSETTSEDRGGGYTKVPNEHTTNEQVRRDAHPPTTKTNPTNPSPVASETAGAKQANRKEQADLDERAQAFVRRAMTAYEATQETMRGQNAAPKAKPNSLVSAFVREVSPLFRDQNVKASLTRALRVVEQTTLAQKDILACLVKAYLVTQKTKTVKLQHRHPEGDNKMPLFVTMFAHFASDCAAGAFGYTDEHLARDIAEDDRLVLFIVEHKLEELLLEDTVTPVVEPAPAWQAEPTFEGDPLLPGHTAGSDSLAEDDAHGEPEQLEQAEGPQQNWISVTDPQDGWSSWDGANAWAQYLREHYPYGVNEYRYDVLPTCYEGKLTGRWVFVFYSRRDPQHCWAIYGNTREVKFHLDSAETVFVAYDGQVGRKEETN